MTFLENFLFLLFSFSLLLCSTLALSTRNIVHSLLFLILSFLSVVFMLFLLECDFIAFVFLLIYIGAIAILFLFALMMLNIKIKNSLKDLFLDSPVGCVMGFLLFSQLLFNFLLRFEVSDFSLTENFAQFSDVSYFNWYDSIETCSNIEIFGLVLYSYFFSQLLIAGFILLLAILGTVVLTFEKTTLKQKDRNQFVFKQITRTS